MNETWGGLIWTTWIHLDPSLPASDDHRLLLKAGFLFLTELSDLKASLPENTWMPIGMGQEATNEVFMEGREEFIVDGLRKGLLQDNRFSQIQNM